MNTLDTRLRFHCEYSLYSDAFKLHIASGDPVRATAKPLEFVAHEPGTVATVGPAIEFREGEAQALIDALWSAGLRPTQGKQSEGVTAAQDRHLQDMRAIAFAKLNVERP